VKFAGKGRHDGISLKKKLGNKKQKKKKGQTGKKVRYNEETEATGSRKYKERRLRCNMSLKKDQTTAARTRKRPRRKLPRYSQSREKDTILQSFGRITRRKTVCFFLVQKGDIRRTAEKRTDGHQNTTSCQDRDR